jgi:hypothetical protein
MATYSLNQLIKIFSDFADSHLQINSFGFGEVYEANGNPKVTGNTPTLWIYPTQATPLENTTIYSFDVRCWDLVTKGEENENDVLSDCQQTLFDFIQFIKHNEIFDINVSGDPSMTPFTEQLADDVTGWECSIDIEVNSINSDCMIPMGSITPFPNPLNCEPVIVTDNGNQITLDAGDTYTCSGGGAGEVDILINGSAWGSFTVPDTEDIPVKNTAGTNLGSKVGANWQIANITLTQPNGSNEAKVAGINLACTLIGALANQDLNDDLTPTQINRIQRQQPTRTGQTTSYRTGDDSDLQMGIGASFSTLSDNNIWGNTNRFTSELGNQTYTNNFVVDHLTGLMWNRVPNAVDTWNNAIDGCNAYTGGTFTDWFLANINQHMTIISWEVSAIGLNYAPFSISSAEFYWTSTTAPSATTNAIRVNNSTGIPVAQLKTNTSKYLYCRKFIPADFGL